MQSYNNNKYTFTFKIKTLIVIILISYSRGFNNNPMEIKQTPNLSISYLKIKFQSI